MRYNGVLNLIIYLLKHTKILQVLLSYPEGILELIFLNQFKGEFKIMSFMFRIGHSYSDVHQFTND